MTEAEVARDFAAVVEKIQRGAEVIVVRNSEPVAVVARPRFRGRSIEECIAQAKRRGSHTPLDEDFGKDVEDVIQGRREPFNPVSWD